MIYHSFSMIFEMMNELQLGLKSRVFIYVAMVPLVQRNSTGENSESG